MKKHLKLILLIIAISSIYFIYQLTNQNNLIYTSIGDSLSLGENSFGATTYGYSDYIRDYLEKENLLSAYNKSYTSKTKTITDLYNDLLTEEVVTIDRNTYNLKRLLRESQLLTISIGLNDLIFEYNVQKKPITEYEENRIVDKVFENYQNLMIEIKKYYQKDIYVIGYYENNTKYDGLIRKLNSKYKELCKKNEDIFIDTSFLSNHSSYFDNPSSYYPNTKGYEQIASKIIRIYEEQNYDYE